jgi:signal transduction histidine kinase
LGTSTVQLAALRDAETAQNAIVSRPVALRTGDQGLLVCVPVYSNKKISGFLVGVFSYVDLISSAIRDAGQGYWVIVYDGSKEIYNPGAEPKAEDMQWAQTMDVHFQKLTWLAQVWPKPGTISFSLPVLPQAAFIGGILMAGLLGFAVYLAETARLHAKGVVATNRQLQTEIAWREQAEVAMREAQKMEAVGQLAGGVAHDFNNLLMVIRGRAELSLGRTLYDDVLSRELQEILGATERASSLTRRLLAFSRKQVLQLQVFDMNALVTQMNDLLATVLGKDIRLLIDLDPELGRVKADPGQMEQVIMNLVFNARDAMRGSNDLSIQTGNVDIDEEWARAHAGTQAGPYVVLMVRDTGHGMAPETLSHIFEPFFTTKDRTKGTGLGLATVYGTVRQSGGCITVSSKVGEGTTFQIYLPRVEEVLTETADSPVVASPCLEGTETILVVEDDNAVRRMTREFLKIKGYTVIEARSAAEAIQLVETGANPIDLVLTDVLMPGMKGRELVQRLAQIRTGMKILYMSAYTEDAAINVGVLNPGTEFIEKPFGPDELAGKVREVLSGVPIARGYN